VLYVYHGYIVQAGPLSALVCGRDALRSIPLWIVYELSLHVVRKTGCQEGSLRWH